MSDDPLRAAVALAKSGRKKEAQELVSTYLRANDDDYRAWLVMSQLIDDLHLKIDCLEQAHDLKPNNERITDQLRKLKAKSNYPSEDKPASQRPRIPTLVWVGAALLVLACALGAVALLIGPSLFAASPSGSQNEPASQPSRQVEYHVTTTYSGAIITYYNALGNERTTTLNNTAWDMSFSVPMNRAMGIAIYHTNGGVSCEANVDGQQVSNDSVSLDDQSLAVCRVDGQNASEIVFATPTTSVEAPVPSGGSSYTCQSRTCSSFSSCSAVQTHLANCPQYQSDLDRDGDGIACESLCN
ncbi:MAG: hypothetical protein GYB68_12580 [Chloroflexi bacterium]|nr:hypothetical protein [Chloroflexota bacterium]